MLHRGTLPAGLGGSLHRKLSAAIPASAQRTLAHRHSTPDTLAHGSTAMTVRTLWLSTSLFHFFVTSPAIKARCLINLPIRCAGLHAHGCHRLEFWLYLDWGAMTQQVLVGFLKRCDGLGQLVKAQAVRALPFAGLVLVTDLDDDLGEGHGPPISLDDVAED
jgi:hypothetical protein